MYIGEVPPFDGFEKHRAKAFDLAGQIDSILEKLNQEQKWHGWLTEQDKQYGQFLDWINVEMFLGKEWLAQTKALPMHTVDVTVNGVTQQYPSPGVDADHAVDALKFTFEMRGFPYDMVQKHHGA